MESESTIVTKTETSRNQDMARQYARDMGKNVREVRDQTRDALANWENLPLEEFLIVVGGVIALALGTLLWFFGLASVTVFGASGPALATAWWIWNLVFGFLVLFAYGMYKRSVNGALLGLIFGILLLFGGISGVIGGIMAIIGYGMALWSSGKLRMPASPPPSA